MDDPSASWRLLIVVAPVTVAVAAALTAGATLILLPWLRRFALARPNARSSHKVPTPQGGGIAVVAVTLACASVAALVLGGSALMLLVPVLAAAVILAILGAIDDVRAIAPIPRLVVQIATVAPVVFALPSELRVLVFLPVGIERALLVIGGVYFVNAVNFMDGLDWMTVAEVVPVTFGLAVIGCLGALTPTEIGVAGALGGAILGFAPFNRPVARLFLGDVGSLPIGLLLGWLLLLVAARGHLAAALLLALYYLADTGVTLLRRLAEGERIWESHRTHFYQQATDNGFSVPAVVARVFAVNLALVALAVASAWAQSALADAATLALGAALVALLLWGFRRGTHRPTDQLRA